MSDRLINLLADLEGTAYAKMYAMTALSSFHDYADIVHKVDAANRQVERAYRAVQKAMDQLEQSK